MLLIDILTLIAGIGSAAGTMYGGYRYLVKPLIKGLKRVKTALDTIEKIQDEFKPNGGTSLRDAINRIEIRLLIEQQARRAMSMAMDVGIFETDSAGMCIWINQYYSNLTGLSLQEAKNYGWVIAIHEDDRDRVVDEWKDAVIQKRAFHMEYTMKNIKSSEISFVKCHAFPICNGKEEVAGFVGIVTRLQQEIIRPKYITN